MKLQIRLLTYILSLAFFCLGCSSGDVDEETPSTVDPGGARTAGGANIPTGPIDKDLERIALPEGFRIDYYAKDVENARSMALSPSGILFVGTRSKDKVYAVVDENKDGIADDVIEVATGLSSPNGVAVLNGDLYVAEISRVIKFPNIEQTFRDKPDYQVVNDKFPGDRHHGWKYIAFGPDNKLYVPVGAPCNVCKEENPIYSTITRMNPDGSELEIYAEGIRNTVGFDWHPQTGNLYFTDNGRDMMGDNLPPDELNRATRKGQHFGFPYCHGGTIKDPEFGDVRGCGDFVSPVQNLGPHVAALGMKFYTGSMFPNEYRNKIFIAEHGSWNRSNKLGYRVMQVELDGSGNATSYKPFAEGWLQGENDWGRPVDVLVLPDGSLLVSDDKKNAIYRITYTK